MPVRHVDEPVERSGPLAGFIGGTEWMIDASGCLAERLQDLGSMLAICDRVVADLGLNVVGDPMAHAFPGHGGVTTLYLLSESHLACHTYPEHEFATFNLYCCRSRPAWRWHEELTNALGARDVHVREFERHMKLDPKPELRGFLG